MSVSVWWPIRPGGGTFRLGGGGGLAQCAERGDLLINTLCNNYSHTVCFNLKGGYIFFFCFFLIFVKWMFFIETRMLQINLCNLKSFRDLLVANIVSSFTFFLL